MVRADAGFVLVELLVVLAIVGLLLAIVLPSVPAHTTPMRLRALAMEVEAALRDTRGLAQRRRADAEATFDIATRRLRTPLQGLSVAPDVAVSILAGGACGATENRARIVFHADGTSCGGVITFATLSKKLRLRVNWVTGSIESADAR